MYNVGGGYNVNTARFAAPVAGSYRFITTVSNTEANKAVSVFFRHGSAKYAARSGADIRSQGAFTVVLRLNGLNAGEDVYVQSPPGDNQNKYAAEYTMFTGHLIHT